MTTSQLVDAIIVMVIVEMAALSAYRRARGRGMKPDELLAFLGAGLGLLVALRVLLGNGPFVLFAAAMLVSLVLHLWHVRQRWS